MADLYDQASGSPAWRILQRRTDAIQIRGLTEVFATLILDANEGTALGTNIDPDSRHSMELAIEQAATEPAGGARPGLPTAVICAPELAPTVASVVEGRGIPVIEQPTSDLDEDILDSLVSHMVGRKMPTEAPLPEDWGLFYATMRDFTENEVWTRWPDSIHFRLSLKIGSQRRDATAIVMGNEEIQHGLVLYPSKRIDRAIFDADPREFADRIPDGTSYVFLEPGEAKDQAPDLRARALRYGWPESMPWTPLPLVSRESRPGEPANRDLQALTLTLHAILDRDQKGPEVAGSAGRASTGQLTLGDGRMGRYRLEVAMPDDDQPPYSDKPGTVHLYAGEVNQDWVPEGTRIRLGAIPWEDADRVRRQVEVYAPYFREMPRVGPRLPVAIVQLDREDANRAIRLLEDHPPEGLVVSDHDGRSMMTLLCQGAILQILNQPSGSAELANFMSLMDANDGGHAIVIAGTGEDPLAHVIARYDCLLRRPPAPRRAPTHPRPKRRKRRK